MNARTSFAAALPDSARPTTTTLSPRWSSETAEQRTRSTDRPEKGSCGTAVRGWCRRAMAGKLNNQENTRAWPVSRTDSHGRRR